MVNRDSKGKQLPIAKITSWKELRSFIIGVIGETSNVYDLLITLEKCKRIDIAFIKNNSCISVSDLEVL